MKRYAKKLALVLLMASTLVASSWAQEAPTPQPGSPDKPQSTASGSSSPAAAKPTATASPPRTLAPATQASATTAKPQTPPANGAGVVWINTDTGVYHKQGTRWYGKTKHGKYMLETDAVKAGYKPAK